MSVETFTDFSQYEIARAQIETWRGECIDVLAQGEALIGAILEIAREAGIRVKLHPLAEQRTLEASRMVDTAVGSGGPIRATSAALAGWQALESRRSLLAHGVVTVTLDREGRWFALFDMASYRGDHVTKGRWAVSEAEAEDFRNEVGAAFTALKQQLGNFRQSIACDRVS